MAESSSLSLVQKILETINVLTSIGEFKTHRNECHSLTRRVKMLVPLFEDVRDLRLSLPDEALTCFSAMDRTLNAAKDLLLLCNKGSKIYLVLQRDHVAKHFQLTSIMLGQALNGLPSLDISDEVREQVELVRQHFLRSNGPDDPSDAQLYAQLMSVLDETHGVPSTTQLEKLAMVFKFDTSRAWKREAQALQGMKLEKEPVVDGIFDERGFEQAFEILNMLKSLFPAEELALDDPDIKKHQISQSTGVSTVVQNAAEPGEGAPNIPDDFKCPISLDLMRDPVIVATGQTYERACIQKWLDGSNKTCPKTGLVLTHMHLTPNHVLRSVINEWCALHGIEVQKKRPKTVNCSPEDIANIDDLIKKLSSDDISVQREAAGELRLLAKRNVEHRICVAEQGAIPLLIKLLTSSDKKTQEHAVTALLNLSINDHNKGQIVIAGAINPIVEVLRKGSPEARENAAATLFSLSVVDENKVTIGSSGAIPALVELLRDGTARGKKDAATALFNLSIYQGNKGRAVRAGVVPLLMDLLENQYASMLDEALAILAILATHPDGRAAIGNAEPTPMLVNIIGSGSPRNKENAAAVLCALCSHDPSHIKQAKECNASGPLSKLIQGEDGSATSRAKRKATNLLELLNKPQVEAITQALDTIHINLQPTVTLALAEQRGSI